MQIALAKVEDYQTNIEDVYLQELSLTLVRFTSFPHRQSQMTHSTALRHERQTIAIASNS